MDLRSGIPFWLAANGILADYPKLQHDLTGQEIVIIGSGISGALAAHELCSAGFRCLMLDRRMLSSGSTWASTAQLNYELDVMLGSLADKYDEAFAAGVYRASVDAVHSLQEVFRSTGIDAGAESRRSLYVASSRSGAKEIRDEYRIRQRNGIPVEYVSGDALKTTYGIDRRCALTHTHAAQVDAYKAAAGLIGYHESRGNLRIYTRTTVKALQPDKRGVTVLTDDGHTIRARRVVCAPGYEAGTFVPKGLLFYLYSTYALVTQPLPEGAFWKDRAQIWETARPYFYARTTQDDRIMMGGQDTVFRTPAIRDALLHRKTRQLLAQCHTFFPHLEVQADFSWCGTFSFTPDGLPYIGACPGIDHVFFALGYGGNGTTFSMIAAEVICNTLRGKPDDRLRLFGFNR